MGIIKTAFLLFKYSKNSTVDDYVDGLLHGLSSIILLTFSTTVLYRLFAPEVLICWENAYDLPIWNDFISTYCYISDLYFVQPNQTHFPSKNKDVRINLYYWIPLIFIFQSALCCLPFWLWVHFSCSSGINVKVWNDYLSGNHSNSKNNNKNYANLLIATTKCNELRHEYAVEHGICKVVSPKNYVSSVYCLYKLFNMLSIVIQLLILNLFLKSSYDTFDAQMILNFYPKLNWKSTGQFSRIMYCDFTRWDDVSGMPMKWVSQCLLPYNSLYEKMSLFLWYWFFALLIITVISFLKLLYFLFVRSSKIIFAEYYLEIYGIDRNHYFFYEFVDTIFKRDLLALFWILTANCREMDVSYFLFDLWAASKDK